MSKPFANVAFDFYDAGFEFTDMILDIDENFEFSKTAYDKYDCSIEFYDVSSSWVMSELIQRIIFDAGFKKAYINHKDGWQTHYTFGTEFLAIKGWRRLMKDGHVYVDEFPETWPKEWLESGYVILVKKD